MQQTFHCLNPHCRTMWVEESNDWVVTSKTQCPFCHYTWAVRVTLGANVKPQGTIVGPFYASGTR